MTHSDDDVGHIGACEEIVEPRRREAVGCTHETQMVEMKRGVGKALAMTRISGSHRGGQAMETT